MTKQEQHIRRYGSSKIKLINPGLKKPLEIYVFGYGSLMYPEGINRGLIKSYDWDDLKVVRLDGYRRGWYVEHNRIHYYGIIRDKTSYLNGILFKIYHPSDLEKLNNSEYVGYIYDLVDVTSHIRGGLPKNAKVYTYVTRNISSRKPNLDSIFYKMSKSYEDRVNMKIKHWGQRFVDEFNRTTEER